MPRTLIVTGLLALMATTVLAAPRPITETLQLAAAHPAVQQSTAQVAARTAGLSAARGAGLPTVSGNLSGGVQYFDDYGTSGTAGVARGGIDMLQPLFDGAGRKAGVQAATARLKGAEENLVWQRRQQAYRAAQAHIALWLAQELATANAGNVAALEAVHATTRNRLNQGDATITELSESASRLASAQARQEELETQLAATRAAYTDAVGAPVDAVAAAPFPMLPLNKASTADDLAAQVAAHPLVQAAAAAQKEAEATTARQRALYYPTLDMAAGASHDAFGSYDREDATTTGAVTLNLKYDFYKGGTVAAALREARALQKAADADRRSTLLAVTAETDAAWKRWLGSAQRTAKQAQAMSEAQNVLGSLESEMRQGSRTLRDLLDARREEVSTRSQWLAALAEETRAGYDLMRWSGQGTLPPETSGKPETPAKTPQAPHSPPAVSTTPQPVLAKEKPAEKPVEQPAEATPKAEGSANAPGSPKP